MTDLYKIQREYPNWSKPKGASICSHNSEKTSLYSMHLNVLISTKQNSLINASLQSFTYQNFIELFLFGESTGLYRICQHQMWAGQICPSVGEGGNPRFGQACETEECPDLAVMKPEITHPHPRGDFWAVPYCCWLFVDSWYWVVQWVTRAMRAACSLLAVYWMLDCLRTAEHLSQSMSRNSCSVVWHCDTTWLSMLASTEKRWGVVWFCLKVSLPGMSESQSYLETCP